MGDLIYKTWQNRSPAGLISVFFCAAKDDHERYFDEITDMILELRKNVAIYYTENIEDLTDEAFERMRLLIVPVTYAFLKPDCVERRKIFNRFVENNIPILPILEERGLFNYFNEICGNMQVLDSTGQDDTAIPFKKKLEKFLDSILIGDETVQQIREAFDAYIFLSYRKKDRKHAERIMHLIHDNPFMRDVAIWYDEYLVPGEQFDDAIRGAMLKSKIVTLLVTPNLVNEDNYIRRIEYPMAVENGKPVLPIGAEPTDKTLLAKIYDGIGEILPADEPDRISQGLAELFHTEGFRENDDPRHLYFIGMAYLLGIDVEVDADRGFDLIYKAAEAGLNEAYTFFVECFMEGRFVNRNYEKALEWQQAYVNLMLDEDGDWDWNMYPESESVRREVCMEYADRLNRLVEIMTACNGVTEDAIEIERTIIETLTVRAGNTDPKELEELKTKYHDEETCKKILQMEDNLLVSMAKEDLLVMLCDTEDPSYKDEIKDLFSELITEYYEFNDTLGFYSERCDLFRYYCNVVQHISDHFPNAFFDEFSMLDTIQKSWMPFVTQYWDEIANREESEDEETREKENEVLTSILYYLAKAETWNIQCLTDRVVNEVSAKKRKQFINRTIRETYNNNVIDLVREDRETMETLCEFLTEEKKEYKRDQIRQDFFRAYGKLLLYIDEYNEAGKLFLEAFRELKDRYESPDNFRGQMINIQNIIEYGRKTDDMLLVYNAYWELDVVNEELYYATGDREAWEKLETDIFRAFDEPGLVEYKELRGCFFNVEDLLVKSIKW